MSRLTGADAYGLMEAYNNVYAPQELTEEQVWEEVENWVSGLIEEGYDLSDYTWEEMYESYIEENTTGGIGYANRPGTAAQLQQRSRNVQDRGGVFGQAYRSINRAFGAKEPSWDKADRDDRRREQTALNRSSNPNWKPNTKNNKDVDTRPPIVTPASPKVAPTKPAAAAQTGDKTKDMATFAKANPALAAAAAERARTRGTSQSDNPLMKGMPGKRPMTPSVQSPTLAKDLGKGYGNKSLLNNHNASKAAPPKPAATSTAPAVSPTPAAAKTTPTPVAPKQTPRQARLNMEMEYDTFDAILEHLVAEGYADTEESALAIMANMSEEWRESIIVEAIDIQEKLKPGTKGQISFSTGKQNFDQKMTEKNPKTGRQRGTPPELKAMGAHGRARSKQAAAERSGDTEAARRNEKRRGKLAHIVYNKTGRIIDRADND